MREKIRKWTADGQFFYPWERQFEKLVTPFEEFIRKQTTSGIRSFNPGCNPNF